MRPSLLPACALLFAAGCGYNTGFGLDELGVKTIGLEIATNLTFRQRLEFFLSRRIQREVEGRIRATLASPGRADAILQVSIIRAAEPILSESANDRVAVSNLALTVTAKLVKRQTGEVIKEGRLAGREEIYINAGETVDAAAESVSEKIGRRLVLFLDPEIRRLEEWRPPPEAEITDDPSDT
jgi:hypothetical protein